MKISGIVGVNDHVEAEKKSKAEYQKITNNLKPVLWDDNSKNKIPSSRIYKGGQLGLFYAKLPNRVYVSKENTE